MFSKKQINQLDLMPAKERAYATIYFSLEEIAKFEPSIIDSSVPNMTEDRYNLMVEISEEIKKQMSANLGHKPYSNLIGIRYAYASRLLKRLEVNNTFFFKGESVEINKCEYNLLIVLSTDSDLDYFNEHNKCIENNVDVKDAYYKKYGFYSRKLFLMEMHTLILRSRLERNKSLER